MKVNICVLIFLVAAVLAPHGAIARPDDPSFILNRSLAQLQKNPDDDSLRQRIIGLALVAHPPLAIPEEARRQFVKGVTLQREARDTVALALAAHAYDQALLLAPWWADAYYNLGIVLEELGRFGKAIEALHLYLAAHPDAEDARAVKDKIYALEAKWELAHTAAPERHATDGSAFSGRWKRLSGNNCDELFFHTEFHLEGQMLVQESVCDRTTTESDECGVPVNAGFRLEVRRIPRAGDYLFEGTDWIGNDVRFEFDGGTAVMTLLNDGNKKTYFKKEG